MSRSKNKVACSASKTQSQKWWLRSVHSRERMAVKAVLNTVTTDAEKAEDVVVPDRREVTNNYDSPKDGKYVVFPETIKDWDEFEGEKLARK